MAHLITGHAGVEHIKPADDGSFNAAIVNLGNVVFEIGERLKGSITGSNTVRIASGDLLMQGRHIRIEGYEDVNIDTGGQTNTSRIDLIVMTYEKDSASNIESARLEVIKGTPTTGTPVEPSYNQGDILAGASSSQMPLYAVKISGVTLSTITKKFVTVPSIKDIYDYLLDYEKTTNTSLSNKAPTNHTHDDRYFTETEITTKLAAKSNLLTTTTVNVSCTGTRSSKGIYTAISGTKAISKSGYTALGILDSILTNGYENDIYNGAEFDGTNINAKCSLAPVTGALPAITLTVKCRVLWVKNS